MGVDLFAFKSDPVPDCKENSDKKQGKNYFKLNLCLTCVALEECSNAFNRYEDLTCPHSNPFGDSELFLKYLDDHFVPEINLSEEREGSLLSFEVLKKEASVEMTPCKTTVETTCNEKNSPQKAEFAERKDVVYKNIIRNLRKHLHKIFTESSSKETLKKLEKRSMHFDEYLNPLYGNDFFIILQ